MQKGTASVFDSPQVQLLMRLPLPRSFANYVGREVFRFLLTVRGLGAFALITLGVMLAKFGAARQVVHPLVLCETARAGLSVLPMFMLLSAALGLLVVGHAIMWLTTVGAINYLGAIMVMVVVRELGPLICALLVLARSGTANVIELGTARALGEVEALEALGIDPVHYLVVPRVVGMALGVFSLTVCLILGTLVSGYFWAFLQDVALQPRAYFEQLAVSLTGLDFLLVGLKTLSFGFIIAIVTCYHGLAHPLHLEEVSRAAVRAVAQSVVAIALTEAAFIVFYLAG
ncbi:conserved membrane hypothetical protein [Verrucomicrobia bacterium]|nr:conserved membrane hypothetical protein [Verrucomicrobiota bacterium]